MDWHAQEESTDPDTEYVRMFNQFFMRGKMSSTYKPVFLKCLLDLSKYHVGGSNSNLAGSKWIEVDGDVLTLDLNFIAARFAKYYWDMEHSFRLKQSPNRTDASIVRIVRERHKLRSYKKPPTVGELSTRANEDLRKNVINSSIKPQVLKYLLTDMKNLYIRQKGTNKIVFNTNIIAFLKDHRAIIKHGINYKLATHLEKFNKMTPQIAAKLDDEDNYPSRYLHPVARRVLDREQEERCFYCDSGYGRLKKRHIDHVIPYNYVFSTETYNCVAACASCNLRKHDRLPHADLFEDITRRNHDLGQRLSGLPPTVQSHFSTYDKVWYERTYDSCLAEYHGNAPLFES